MTSRSEHLQCPADRGRSGVTADLGASVLDLEPAFCRTNPRAGAAVRRL